MSRRARRLTRRRMKVLDLFCGAAGHWSLGMHWAGYTTVAACEIDPWRREIFSINNPGVRMYADVRELDAEQLRRDLRYLPDVIVGSPPCQAISAANSKGTGIDDDHLFWDWLRLVLEARPVWCCAENSPRARTDGIDGILDALEQSGYACWPCVVGAYHAGANHERDRMWLIAADTTRADLWVEPWRSGGANGRGEAVAGEYDWDAPLVERLRLGRVLRRRCAESAQADLHDDPADADSARHPIGQSLAEDDGAELPAALRDIGRAWPHWNGGLAGLAASCAAAGARRVDDGRAPGLADIRVPKMDGGTTNALAACIAAYGDAIVPQVAEAIGRAMTSLIARPW
jgi:DNA (cytosine-5)-methyltransferase 1